MSYNGFVSKLGGVFMKNFLNMSYDELSEEYEKQRLILNEMGDKIVKDGGDLGQHPDVVGQSELLDEMMLRLFLLKSDK